MYERMTPDDIKKENKSLANRINQLNSIYKETKDTSILSEIKALQNKIYANKIKVGKIVEQMNPSLKKQYLENFAEKPIHERINNYYEQKLQEKN